MSVFVVLVTAVAVLVSAVPITYTFGSVLLAVPVVAGIVDNVRSWRLKWALEDVLNSWKS